jgi:hypothetical protein
MNEDLEGERSRKTDQVLNDRFAVPPEVKKGPGRPKKEITEAQVAVNVKHGSEVWVQACCAAIISKQVLSPSDVQKAAIIADEVVKQWKERYK